MNIRQLQQYLTAESFDDRLKGMQEALCAVLEELPAEEKVTPALLNRIGGNVHRRLRQQARTHFTCRDIDALMYGLYTLLAKCIG
ncbi:MAG: hypothetical protein COT71_02900 [Candidatus Andersenbacteria bacterium CG10_big_fil_rev_8_21_14_0_10_54_11]|uniref:Globin-sensor domain-containing protein n=1 Tax=Candidatus Andersenbacteria bacterium CG10_big_fil_rev_8_21_14_0_10_54_11 TaxID=1974485 RepID=A0A2M6WZ37_9BACT|nr:MAG: hypothetical protein COT71_02900 [Candidatus Andersenbacteria bacterium CG10_big_fil_rev_8_21_14_0_10_54_11]